MEPYKTAFTPVRDWYILKTQQVGDRIAWVPIYTYLQVQLNEK
jgi:hypothetical protein